MPTATTTATIAEPGLEPGLRFALLCNGKGGAYSLDWAGIRAWKPGDGLLWVHLEQDAPETEAWLREASGLDPIAVDALLQDESRPRVLDFGDSLAISFRGVNVCAEDGTDLVPVHIWAEADRVISLRGRTHQLMALRDIRQSYVNGRGPRSAADLIAVITESIIDHIVLIVDGLEEELGALEETYLGDDGGPDWRLKLGHLRRRSSTLRRYIAPQRDALYRLQHDDASWLTERSKLRLREVSDRIIQHLEDLDAVRDRASILHEDLTARISERISLTSNRLAALAGILLPPTIITGALGMNVEGIPDKDNPLAFTIVCLICIGLVPISLYALNKFGWLD